MAAVLSFSMDMCSRAWLLLCGYKSFKAIESTETSDDTQWLTFWTVVSIVQFAEFWLDHISRILPFYSEAKFGLLVWLGAFRGAHMIYEKGIRPFLKQHQSDIDKHLDKAEAQAKAAMKK
eukprot:TRINITY_DN3292_c0_g4_i1.p1 TRINITY_DN3292_c0_g4~~TRINITY_DN3292_c0_g4_i1.p1  ORF type:complete len:138 (+),score=46.07 TRINITY_DN3292_c0_g4_i1:57-416(+)